MEKFEINIPEDVTRFFFWLVFTKRINFHPDDPFKNYVDLKTKEATFSEEEAAYYDGVMEKCLDVCAHYGKDVYEIAAEVLELFIYCDRKGTEESGSELAERNGYMARLVTDAAKNVDAIIGRTSTDESLKRRALGCLKKVSDILFKRNKRNLKSEAA